MTTTMFPNSHRQFLKLAIAVAVSLICCLKSQAQAPEKRSEFDLKSNSGELKSYGYSFSIKGVKDRAAAKLFSEAARGLFDGVARFDEQSGWFTTQTSYSFEGIDVRMKIGQLGYELEQFKPSMIHD